jgi:hypothetical protein
MGTVFVSYSHDSPEHLNRVLALSNRLRREGVDCYIDQYEESPPEGWPTWCSNQVEDAEFVLVIRTQVYDRRFRGREQPKQGWGDLGGFRITRQLYDSASKNTKFIPVLFCSDDATHIPITLRGATTYRRPKKALIEMRAIKSAFASAPVDADSYDVVLHFLTCDNSRFSSVLGSCEFQNADLVPFFPFAICFPANITKFSRNDVCTL